MIYKAVQQIMLGTVCKTELQTKETLTTIKAAGYDGIELNGFMIRPTPFLVRMLTKFSGMPVGKGGNYNWKELIQQSQLNVVSIHEDLGTIQRDPDFVIQETKDFRTDTIVITGMYRFDYSDRKAVSKLAQDLNNAGEQLKQAGVQLQSVIFCGQFIHAILFCSLLLRLLSFDFSLRIFLAQAGQYLDAPEPGTYSTPHTVQFLAGIAAHRFVGMICNSSTKPMNL